MPAAHRSAAALTLAALALTLPFEGEPTSATTSHTTLGEDDTAAACGSCHTDQHAEWKGAGHAKAWIDPIFQKWLEGRTPKSRDNCARCHVPEPVLADIGNKPKLRSTHADDGVTCVVCHNHEGKIHGPFGAKTDAHTSVKSPYLTTESSAELCNSCHKAPPSPVLPIGKDYEKSWAGHGRKTCIECHMPEVERAIAYDPKTKEPTGPIRAGRRHTMLGPSDAEFCASAFELSAAVKDGKVVLSVENKAGHRVPGLMIRAFAFEVTQLDAHGEELATGAAAITGKRGERLEVLTTREFPFAAKPGAAKLRVVVQQRLFDEKYGVDEDLGTVLTQMLDL